MDQQTQETDDWVVQPGTDVLGSDNRKVGEVDDIQDGYLVVRKGFFFPKDHYIPFSAIAGHDQEHIVLNVTADDAVNQSWDTPGGAAASNAAAGAPEMPGSATAYDAAERGAAPATDDAEVFRAGTAGSAPAAAGDAAAGGRPQWAGGPTGPSGAPGFASGTSGTSGMSDATARRGGERDTATEAGGISSDAADSADASLSTTDSGYDATTSSTGDEMTDTNTSTGTTGVDSYGASAGETDDTPGTDAATGGASGSTDRDVTGGPSSTESTARGYHSTTDETLDPSAAATGGDTGSFGGASTADRDNLLSSTTTDNTGANAPAPSERSSTGTGSGLADAPDTDTAGTSSAATYGAGTDASGSYGAASGSYGATSETDASADLAGISATGTPGDLDTTPAGYPPPGATGAYDAAAIDDTYAMTDTAPAPATAGMDDATAATGAADAMAHAESADRYTDAEGTIRVPVWREALQPTKTQTQIGRVRITTRIVAEDTAMDVPVEREQVRVERVTVDLDPGDDEAGRDLDLDGDGIIDVPVYGDDVQVTVTRRIVEEIRITKETVNDIRTVTGTVRRREVTVDEPESDTTGTSPPATSSATTTGTAANETDTGAGTSQPG